MKISASVEMSGSTQSRAATTERKLDELLNGLQEKAASFVRLGPIERAALLRACMPTLAQAAQGWVEAACKAKGLSSNSPAASEEWLGGPMVTMRGLRLYVKSLEEIAQYGNPRLPAGAFRQGRDGRTEVEIFPMELAEKALFSRFSCYLRMEPGLDERAVRDRQASHYHKQERRPGVSLILGAGNVASIPPTDALHKMLVDGKVCVVKLNPVNEYLGPFYEQAFAPLINRGYLHFVYGGADVGSYLSSHPLVEDIHITGSDRTHDLIVWGPEGPDRDRRKAANDPLLKKSITSELGCVTPVMLVPGDYTTAELRFVAENVATQVINNASFNCNAAKVLVTAQGWAQREIFVGMLRDILASTPPRLAYYPGAAERFAKLTKDVSSVVKLGRPEPGKLPWALLRGLDPKADDLRYTMEPFCSVISEVALPENDPARFLQAAASFSNEKLWGTLSCSLIINPRTESNPEVRSALDAAVDELRYGVVAINHWPGVVYGAMTPPWGGHPSATLQNVQSGIGFVHNTPMLEGIEKAVWRGPLTVFPKPPWFATNRRAHIVAKHLVDFEQEPHLWKLPRIAGNALLG